MISPPYPSKFKMYFAKRLKANRTCDVSNLAIDKACLDVVNTNNKTIQLFSQTVECYVCDGVPLGDLPPNSNTTFIVDTKFPIEVHLKDSLNYCYKRFTFVERGYYGWNVTDQNCSNLYTIHEPPKPYMPILAAFVLFFFLSATWALGTYVARSGMMSRFLRREMPDVQSDLGRLQENEPSMRQPERVTKSSTRAKFLDTFRGIAVLLMIFVNNGGGKYWFFNHSPWNGLTLADLVLPFFAWIMGFTVVISMRTQLRISVSRFRIITRCLRRSVTLILLGLIINSLDGSTPGSTIKNLRFPGILQLLGVTYFICATIEAIFTKAQRTFQYGRFGFLQDVLDGWAQWLVVIAITATHLLITFLLHVPGCPRGYLGPGGLHLHKKYENCTAGAAGYIDRTVLGTHIYHKKEIGIYGAHPPYDPEGIMSIMSAVLLVYMGIQAGRTMLTFHQGSSRVIRWLIWSIVTGIVAGILCNFSKEDGVIPVNKSMMSLSYVLATSSIAFFTNAVLYVIIDLQHWWNGSPFLYAGTNAIFLYVGHYFTKGVFPWAWDIDGIKTHANVLSMNLWTTTLWAIIAYIMYKKDIILTV